MVIIYFLHISCAWEDNCLQVKWEHATLQKYQLSKDHFNQIVCCGWVELVTGLYWFCPPPRLYEWQWPIYNLVVDPVICTSWLSYLLKWRWPPYQVTVHCPSSYSCGPRCARCPPWDVTNQTKPRMVFSRCSPTCLEAWRPPLLCWPSVRKIQIVSSQVLPPLPSLLSVIIMQVLFSPHQATPRSTYKCVASDPAPSLAALTTWKMVSSISSVPALRMG